MQKASLQLGAGIVPVHMHTLPSQVLLYALIDMRNRSLYDNHTMYKIHGS